MNSYAVKEVFATVQGEGMHAGTPAVFVRLAGCNLWSGSDKTRERDAKKNGGEQCGRWCDTDFVRGKRMTAAQVAATVRAAWGTRSDLLPPLVVVTGGEPLLQLDEELLTALRPCRSKLTCIETNGTRELPVAHVPDVWVTCSPKVEPERIKLAFCDELKVVFPSLVDPYAYAQKLQPAHAFLQPRAVTLSVGRSLLAPRNATDAALEYVLANPVWRISTQTHKVNGYR